MAARRRPQPALATLLGVVFGVFLSVFLASVGTIRLDSVVLTVLPVVLGLLGLVAGLVAPKPGPGPAGGSEAPPGDPSPAG
jgi:hypothetical protein